MKFKHRSLAYNPQGGRIVLHTACDKEVATFAFGQEAQWRNGKDNRPHLYVEGNPVSFRDPSGNALSNSWMYAIGTYVIAKSQGMNDQQAMIYAASAYGVGRAKDKNQGDFWKHNDISRGITSAWNVINKFQKKISEDFRKTSLRITLAVDVKVSLNLDDGEINSTFEADPKLKLEITHRKKALICFSYEVEGEDDDALKTKGSPCD